MMCVRVTTELYKKEKSKRCRDGMPKSTQTREDMKMTVKIVSSILHNAVTIYGFLYIYLHFYILPALCTFWHAIPTSLFIFNDSFSFLYFFGNILSYIVK